MVIRSGTYVGNGTSQTIVMNDMGGTPDLVWIANDNGFYEIFALSAAPADHSFYVANDTSHVAGRITSLASNQFSVGSGAEANANGTNYYWLAVRDDGSSDFQVGSFTGTGSSQDVAINFNPTFVAVKGDVTAANQTVLFWKDGNDAGNAGHKEGFSDTTDAVTGYGSGGGNHFTVGSNVGANNSGDLFYFFVIKDTAGKFIQGTYTGNGSTQTISGFTGTLTNLFIKHNASTDGLQYQTRDFVGTGNTFVMGPIAPTANGITALASGSFDIGTSTKVNNNTDTYHYYGFIAPAPINTTTSTTTTTSTSTTTTSTSTTTTHSTSTSTTTTSTSTTTTSTSTTTTSTSTSTTTTSTSTTTTSTSTTTTSTSTTHSTSTSTTTTVPYVFRVSQESKEPLNISVRTGTKATL